MAADSDGICPLSRVKTAEITHQMQFLHDAKFAHHFNDLRPYCAMCKICIYYVCRNGSASNREGNSEMKTAYQVTVRHLATGCDFHLSLFAQDAANACERSIERARFMQRIPLAKMKELSAKGIAVFRIVS